MKEIVDATVNYIKRENTNYALLINGKWGTGKTFFWESVLVDKIKDMKLEPVYISLYGVTEIDQIAEKIFFAIHNKVAKGRAVINELDKALKKYTGASFKFMAEFFLNDYSKYVLCFDDMERINMDIRIVLGYLTNLVDKYSAKVIIIAYEEELENTFLASNIEAKFEVALKTMKDEERSDKESLVKKMKLLFNDYNTFRRTKEKLIGKTIEFIPEFDEAIENIVNYFKSEYGDFVRKNRKLIINVFNRSKTNNLRILRYCLADHEQVYKYIKRNHLEVSALAEEILEFHLASAFELMTGEYTKEDFSQYTSIGYAIIEFEKDKDLVQNSKSLVPFLEKYFPGSFGYYSFYRSIWRLILEGRFIEENFDEEVKGNHSKEEKDTSEYFLQEYWTLSDLDFENRSKEILDMIKLGKSPFSLYLKLYNLFEKLVLNGAISNKLEEIEDVFIKGSTVYETKLSNPVRFDNTFEFFDKNISESYKRFKSRCYRINEDLRFNSIKNDILELEKMIEEDANQFCINIEEKNGKYSRYMVFRYIDSNKLMKSIERMNNKTIINFRNALDSRYEFENIRDYYLEELEGLIELKKSLELLISEHKKSREASLKIYVLNVLKETVQSIVNRLDNSKN